MVGNMTSKIFRVIPEQFEIQRKREWLLFLAPIYVILRNVLWGASFDSYAHSSNKSVAKRIG